MADFGIPEYHEKLSRKLGDAERPNIIYPLAMRLAHIFPDPEDSRNYYILVEPVVGRLRRSDGEGGGPAGGWVHKPRSPPRRRSRRRSC
jgi:hypothetical protein